MPTPPDVSVPVLDEDVTAVRTHLGPLLSRLDGARVLVTGGAGFLGYLLVHVLAARDQAQAGAEVTVLDTFARGRPRWLAQLQTSRAVSVLERSVTDPLQGGYDYLIHAASIASPTFYRQHPLATMDANVLGLRSLLDYARARAGSAQPVAGLLFFSTSEIYGDPPPEWIPTPETYRGNVSCTGPRACYDESKRYGETLCVTFAQEFGLPISIVRPFNNYGPGLRLSDRRVIPDFARDMLAGRDLTVLSDGSPTRTFCYVADAVDGYLRALLLGRPGESYNIGTEGPEVTIGDLAERCVVIARDLFGYAGRVVHRAPEDPRYLTDNPVRRCPSIAKAREQLGYVPRTSLDEGLRRTMRWYAAVGEEI
jgi:dTDP-glucose 4,6-dehydratase/UDP-glucuronate decarboxylase